MFSVYARYFIFTDGTVYATLGESLATGEGLVYCGGTHLFYPPGYPLAIAVYYWFFHDAELAGHLVSCTAYVASVLLTFWLAYRLNPLLLFASLAAAVVMIHPSFILHASYVLSESLFTAVVMGGAICCWVLSNRERTPLWLWGLWGALNGWLYLIRADGAIYAPLQLLFVIAFAAEAKRTLIVKSGLGVAVMLAVMAPYLWLIHDVTGQWQLSSKTSVIIEYARIHTQAEGDGREITRQASQIGEDGQRFTIDRADDSMASFILSHPHETLRRIAYNSSQLVSKPGLAFGWIHVLFLAAIALHHRGRVFTRNAFFIALHLAPIALFLLLYIDKRFLLAFMPFLAMIAAYAAAIGFQWGLALWRRLPRTAGIAMLVIALIAALPVGLYGAKRIVPKLQNTFGSIHNLPHEHREMGEWMKEHLDITPTTRISHRNPWASFYAGGCHARTPYTGDLDTLGEWADDSGVDYLIVDERMTLPYMPVLGFLLDDSQTHQGLTHLHTIENPMKIVLYRFDGNDSRQAPGEITITLCV